MTLSPLTKRLGTGVAALALTGSALGGSALADSSGSASGTQHHGASHAATQSATHSQDTSAKAAKTYLVYDKAGITNSRLKVVQKRKGKDKVIASYRAGSGVTKHACRPSEGWLPNGKYSIDFHQKHYNGSLIKGYVIKLQNKKCSGGTQRTDLFIHSEMTKGGGQGSSEPRRWDGAGDYKSNGCIKLHPKNIKSLFATMNKHGWSKGLKVTS